MTGTLYVSPKDWLMMKRALAPDAATNSSFWHPEMNVQVRLDNKVRSGRGLLVSPGQPDTIMPIVSSKLR